MRAARFTLCAALAVALAIPARPALAIDYHRWFWSTIADPNPLPFSECIKRANSALTARGFTPHQSGTNPVFVDATVGSVSASILCIQEPKGFHMTLLVMSDDPTHTSVNVGKGINAAFWGTTTASAGEGVDGVWDLTSNCNVFVSGTWGSTITLFQAPGGGLSGSVENDPLQPSIVTDPTQSFLNGNNVSLVLHPSDWVGVLNLSGQLSGSTIAGKVHHNGNDDCTFTMTRT